MNNKDAVILAIAKEHFFVDTLETRNRDSLDFHVVGAGSIRAALTAAMEYGHGHGYVQGQQSVTDNPQASTQSAPTTPRELTSQVYAVTDAECTVQALTGGHEGLVDKIEVCVDRMDKGRLFIYIPLKFAEDTEYMYEHCKAQRVDVFKAIVEATLEVKRLLD